MGAPEGKGRFRKAGEERRSCADEQQGAAPTNRARLPGGPARKKAGMRRANKTARHGRVRVLICTLACSTWLGHDAQLLCVGVRVHGGALGVHHAGPPAKH